MSEWSIEYEIIDKKNNPNTPLRRSSTFRQLKWVRGDVLARPIEYFGISRTVPAGEKPIFKKLMRPSYRHTGAFTSIEAIASQQVGMVLGKSVDDFKRTTIDSVNTPFYIGYNLGNEYSEFHFGAGESSIIRIISAIEPLPTNSLILIEEIENGLHPVATRRLVEYLIDAASRKSIQAIFTTHSDEALFPLPSEAIWAALDGTVQQGKLSIRTLRAVSGRIDTKLAIFVEDDFAKHWVEAIIRADLADYHDQIDVHAVAGDGNAVRIHQGHRVNPSVRFQSLCIIDGDSQQTDNPAEGIIRLPGSQPERTVFDAVVARMPGNIALLTVACQLAPTEQDRVDKIVRSIGLTNRDPHLLYSQLGIDLGFVPEVIIRGAFLSRWILENASAMQHVVQAIRDSLADADARQAQLPPPPQARANQRQANDGDDSGISRIVGGPAQGEETLSAPEEKFVLRNA